MIDLAKVVKNWKREGREILIKGDLSSSLQDKILQGFTCSTSLSDVISISHGYIIPPTYHKGSETIYHMLATERVMTTIRHCGILPRYSYLISDHRPLYLDVDIGQLLQGKIYPIRTMTPTFHSKQKTRGKQVREKISKGIRESVILERVKELKKQPQ